MVIRRGEIWWASLGEPRGSGPGHRRPVVVIQSDAFNRSSIGTVIVAAITSNLHLSGAPGNVRLRARQSKLSKASVVNVSQVLTVDKRCLTERLSRLPDELLSKVDAGLRLALSLQHGGS
jgi:mRNA interferase MazF